VIFEGALCMGPFRGVGFMGGEGAVSSGTDKKR